MNIDRCTECFDLGRQAAALANNQMKLAALGAECSAEAAEPAFLQISAIAKQLRVHGHKEAELVDGLATLLAGDLTSEKTRELIANKRDELRVALGMLRLVPNPPSVTESPGGGDLVAT